MREPPIGYDSFSRVREEGMLYVDKTALIDRILTKKRNVYLFTRPRRFGKSLNLSMLDAYFNMEYADRAKGWFDGLDITRLRPDDLEMSAYPVVFLNMKDLTGNCYDEVVGSLRGAVGKLYGRFEYLKDSEALSTPQRDIFIECLTRTHDVSTLTSAVTDLCGMLEAHHGKKVILLIDEYDRAVNSSYGTPYQKDVLKLVGRILSPALKSNDSLKFAAVTGVMQIAKEGIFSGMNNADVDNIFGKRFDDMFGFTADDVRAILDDAEHPEKFDEVREWYDGYRFGNADIYNPWSVLSYVGRGFEPGDTDWTSTGSLTMVKGMIDRGGPEVYTGILAMSSGETRRGMVNAAVTFDEMTSGTNALYSVMAMSGYLKAIPDGGGSRNCTLSAPNREISDLFLRSLLEIAGAVGMAESLSSVTLSGDTEKMRTVIREYLEPMSHRSLGIEPAYGNMLYGAYRALCSDHEVYPERRAGDGISDIILKRIRGSGPNVVIELKRLDPRSDASEERLLKEARAGIAQIHDRDYPRTLKGRTLLYGIAFHRKDVAVVMEERVRPHPPEPAN